MLSFWRTNSRRFSNKFNEVGLASLASGLTDPSGPASSCQLMSDFLPCPDGVVGADAAGFSSSMATESRSSLFISLSMFSLDVLRPESDWKRIFTWALAENAHRWRKYHCTAGLQLKVWIKLLNYTQITMHYLIRSNPVLLNWRSDVRWYFLQRWVFTGLWSDDRYNFLTVLLHSLNVEIRKNSRVKTKFANLHHDLKTSLILSTGSTDHALSMCILRSLWL